VANHDGVTSGISTHLEFAVVLIEAGTPGRLRHPALGEAGQCVPGEQRRDSWSTRLGSNLTGTFIFRDPMVSSAAASLRWLATRTRLGWTARTPAAKDDIVVLGELHVPVDRSVIIDVSSKDVIHNFCLPDMRIAQDAIPGQVIPMWFRPIKTWHLRSGLRPALRPRPLRDEGNVGS
jgi:cytochrome c oxidase subunit 2